MRKLRMHVKRASDRRARRGSAPRHPAIVGTGWRRHKPYLTEAERERRETRARTVQSAIWATLKEEVK